MLVAMQSFPSQATEMNLVEQFESLVAAKRWAEALPVIKEIVQSAPSISTSWRNYGVCLDEVGRHQEAAKAFAKAYELQPDDFGTQYRIFRSLALAGDRQGFISFAERESRITPEILELISEAGEFKAMSATDEFRRLLKNHGH